jgi:hypothetical protein
MKFLIITVGIVFYFPPRLGFDMVIHTITILAIQSKIKDCGLKLCSTVCYKCACFVVTSNV